MAVRLKVLIATYNDASQYDVRKSDNWTFVLNVVLQILERRFYKNTKQSQSVR